MEVKARKRRKFPWWIVAIGALLAIIVYQLIPRPIQVQAARVETGVLQLLLSSTGVVEGTVSDVSSRLTARVALLNADEGDPVTAGQVLAQLESEDVQANVRQLEASLTAAEDHAASLEQSLAAEAAQVRAAVSRARANTQAVRENLRLLEAGARTEDIEAQRAVVRQARAQATEARRNYERAQQLHAAGAISTQRLDNARTVYQTAVAQLEAQEQLLRKLEAGPRPEEIAAVRAQVRAAQAAEREAQAGFRIVEAKRREVDAAQAGVRQAQAALQNARVQLSYTTIRSPITGMVVRKHKEVGEIVSPFEVIYTVAKPGATWVTAEIDEEDVAAVAPGQQVTITLDAYPGRSAAGTVTRISRIAEPKDVGRVRAKIIRARIDVREGDLPLRPGMEVNVTGSAPAGASTLLVPNDAVIRLGDQDSVYVIQAGRARRREVTVGQSNFELTQVLSGLSAGEQVAVSNLERLSDGARVKIVPKANP
ncbi:MAG: efflux RND transporter periplasmic adaptor subunit [Armatimonadota bacterium]